MGLFRIYSPIPFRSVFVKYKRSDDVTVVWNNCPDIPDVDLPPWTNPATLNASLVGNLTSNSGSVSNVTKNSTLALDDLQSLNSSGSLLQWSSPNAVGTS